MLLKTALLQSCLQQTRSNWHSSASGQPQGQQQQQLLLARCQVAYSFLAALAAVQVHPLLLLQRVCGRVWTGKQGWHRQATGCTQRQETNEAGLAHIGWHVCFCCSWMHEPVCGIW